MQLAVSKEKRPCRIHGQQSHPINSIDDEISCVVSEFVTTTSLLKKLYIRPYAQSYFRHRLWSVRKAIENYYYCVRTAVQFYVLEAHLNLRHLLLREKLC